MESNTKALPLCFSNSLLAAAGLITAPRGARFPFNTAIPAESFKGLLLLLITVSSKISASSK